MSPFQKGAKNWVRPALGERVAKTQIFHVACVKCKRLARCKATVHINFYPERSSRTGPNIIHVRGIAIDLANGDGSPAVRMVCRACRAEDRGGFIFATDEQLGYYVLKEKLGK